MAGSYQILEKIGNSYRINLSVLIKVHSVMLPNRLHKAVNDLISKQHNDPPPAIKVDSKEEWEVKNILAVWKR